MKKRKFLRELKALAADYLTDNPDASGFELFHLIGITIDRELERRGAGDE